MRILKENTQIKFAISRQNFSIGDSEWINIRFDQGANYTEAWRFFSFWIMKLPLNLS